jgi:alpha-galactosidase/6-phospho-beta-glucosidase family protein
LTRSITPLRLGPLPEQLAAPLARACLNLEVLIEAALKGSRELSVQSYLNDPYCTDVVAGPALVNELIDALLPWLPRFEGKQAVQHGV